MTTFSGVPAAVQVRGNRQFVTQVAWNGDEIGAKGTPEDVRVGWHATMIGRTLDQGILVKLVIEDTEIRGVHKRRRGLAEGELAVRTERDEKRGAGFQRVRGKPV